MPCVDKFQLSGGQRQKSHAGRDKHSLLIALAELVVGIHEHLLQTLASPGVIVDQGLGNHHKQGRRNTLSGHVRDHHGQMVLIHQEKVVEIPSNLLGRVHGRVDIELRLVREGREDPGQHIRLNLGGHVQLRADSFLLGRHPGQIVHIGVQVLLHFLHRFRKIFNLIPRADRQFLDGGFLFPAHAFLVRDIGGGGRRQLIDRADNFAVYKIHHKRHHRQGGHGKSRAELKQEGVPVVHHLLHGNVHHHIADHSAVLIHNRRSGGAQPAKIPGIADIGGKPSERVLKHRLILIIEHFPGPDGAHAVALVGVHHIDSRPGRRIGGDNIQVQNIVHPLDIPQLLQLPAVIPILHAIKERKILLPPLLRLLVPQTGAAVNPQNLIRVTPHIRFIHGCGHGPRQIHGMVGVVGIHHPRIHLIPHQNSGNGKCRRHQQHNRRHL